MKMLIVVGARPNFMKAAPLLTAIEKHNERAASPFRAENGTAIETIEKVLVHTGQHYDEALSKAFFADLDLPEPDIHLGVGSGSHAVQTAEIMTRFEAVLLEHLPDVVAVLGDVNSTLGCALVAAKVSLDSTGKRPLIAHVEAGLRSFDSTMPEEINRILVDHVSDLLFVTEESGIRNLRKEGVPAEKIHFVGNGMIDSLLAFQDKAELSAILEKLDLRVPSLKQSAKNGVRRYALLTLHRPANVDNREAFLNILEGLQELASSCPVIFSAHPRTCKNIVRFGLGHFFKTENGTHSGNGIRMIESLGYLDFLCLMKHAALVVTDSGGIQEETTCLGIPCVTVRENTERPVTVTQGTNMIAGTTKQSVQNAVKLQMNRKINARRPEKWDGKAGGRTVEAIVAEFQERKRLPLGERSLARPRLKENRKKLLAVASGGGHWVELLRLGRAWIDFETVFVTVNPAYGADVPGRKFYSICDATRETRIRLARATLKLLWIICTERPDVIISTGAAPGYIALRIGKLIGAKTVWLDSIANAEELSLSGAMAGRYADLWLTQWAHLAGENGPYFRGAVL
jgi:UDP-N-acetylglucosamine 2-epimerase (non-hydrolysing)